MEGLLVIGALLIIIYYIYDLFTATHSYWSKKGVKGPTPYFILGNISGLENKATNMHPLLDRLYKEYPNESVIGIYQGLIPTLVVKDPDLIKAVLVKDFNYFVNRGVPFTNDPITRNIFVADGDEWKTLRQKITPIFTTGKLKGMMSLLNTCIGQFISYLDTLAVDQCPKEFRNLMMKYTMKSITSIAFGLDIDTFCDTPTEFEAMANKIFQLGGLRSLIFVLNNFCPGLLAMLHIKSINQEVRQFFLKLVKEIVKEREGKPKVRNDFMDFMIDLKEEGTLKREKDGEVVDLDITDELITAQAMAYYGVGFDTTSGAMSFLLYELAKNPSIQDRCCYEVDKVMKKYNEKLDYEALKQLEYLSMTLDETLRIYPPGGSLFRQCVQDYTFQKINVKIDRGTKVLIPVLSMHRDPKYFPNPEVFDPDRFLQGNKELIHDYYMPFGDGPRNCIGLRFSRVQSLLGIANFLYKYRVSVCERTPENIVFDYRKITLTSRDGIWLNMEKRR